MLIFNYLLHSIIFLLFLVISGKSQDVENIHLDSGVLLKETIVYSSRIEAKDSQIGKNITILQGEDLEKYPINSLDELLRYLPSVEVQSRGGFGMQADITLRGSTFNQVLILIDGMRVNDPLTGHFNSNIPISPIEIAQIEIVRGSSSAAFGADAVGGMVHIITKVFEKKFQEEELSGKLGFQYGEENLISTNSGVFFNKKNWKIATGILHNSSDGQALTSDTLRGDFDLKTFSLSASWKVTEKFSLALRTTLDQRTFNAQYFYTNSNADFSREEVRRWWNQGYLFYQFDKQHQLEFLWGYQVTNDSFLFSPSSVANIHETSYLNLQLNYHIQLPSGNKFIFGQQSDKRTIESNDRGNHYTWRNGLYGMAIFNLKERLYIVSGLRLAHDESYGFEWLPQLDLSYHIGNSQIKGSISRSIRAADFTERYISRNFDFLSGGRNLGNPNLQAENSWNYELGGQINILRSMSLKSTLFYRDANNLIDYISTNESDIPIHNRPTLEKGENYFFAQNFSDITTYGYEIEYWLKSNISKKSFIETTLGLLYVNTDGETDQVSKYIANHAHFLVTGNMSFVHSRFLWSSSCIWKKRDFQQQERFHSTLEKSYIVWNTKLAFSLREIPLSFTFQIQNIFNEQYADILGAKLPNRWFMGGIDWKF